MVVAESACRTLKLLPISPPGTLHEVAAPLICGNCFNSSLKLFTLLIKVESHWVSSGGLTNNTWSILKPSSFLFINLSCRSTTMEPTINATVILNWPMTNTFLKAIPFFELLSLPFNTAIGLNEERTNAG